MSALTLDEALRVEQELNKLVEQIKTGVAEQICSTPFPNAKILSNSPSVFTIRLSNLENNWSAKYYSNKTQAELVAKELNEAETVSGLVKRVEGLAEERKAGQQPLNNQTVAILNSFLRETTK